jgi:hypothetical protein
MIQFLRTAKYASLSIFTLIAVLVLLSISFHAVELAHSHPAGFHEESYAIVHGDDRKWWFLLIQFLFATSLLSLIVNLLSESRILMRVAAPVIPVAPQIFHPIKQALRKGTLAPKYCE